MYKIKFVNEYRKGYICFNWSNIFFSDKLYLCKVRKKIYLGLIDIVVVNWLRLILL